MESEDSSPPLVSIQSQKNQDHNFLPYFYKTRFNITLQSTSTSFKWFLPSDFLTKMLYAFILILSDLEISS